MNTKIIIEDVATVALLYRKAYASTDMISYDKCIKYYEVINEKLKEIDCNNITPYIGRLYESIDSEKLFYRLTDENNKLYYVLNPRANLEKAWDYYINQLPCTFYTASINEKALNTIGLKTGEYNKIESMTKSEKVKQRQLTKNKDGLYY